MNALTVTVPYLSTASINHCFIRGQVRYGYKPAVREWKSHLTLLVQNQLVFHPIKPPIQIQYCIFYPSRTRKGDPPNYVKIIQDGVCEGLGFDDDMSRVTIGPTVGIKTTDKVGAIMIFVREIETIFSVVSPEFGNEIKKMGLTFTAKDGITYANVGISGHEHGSA